MAGFQAVLYLAELCQEGRFLVAPFQEGQSPVVPYPAARSPAVPYKKNDSRSAFLQNMEICMKLILVTVIVLAVTSPIWAEEETSGQPRKGSVRVQDLPKPIPELLRKIQQLSGKIEPEISRLGSTLGQELKVTVKKLCDELQCQDRSDVK